MIAASGYEQAFLVFGLAQGGIVFVMAWGLLVAPPQLLAPQGQAEPDRARLHAR
jgi:OFA family oxalate/formate antiporter-like MFS transporter